MTEKPEKYTEMGFHDDELLGVSIDFETLKAVIKIKSFSWNEVKSKEVPDKLKNNNKCYCATFDKFIEIHLKLKYPDDSKKDMVTFTAFPMQPESILWCYIADDLFSLTCIKSNFDAYIENYEIKEVV